MRLGPASYKFITLSIVALFMLCDTGAAHAEHESDASQAIPCPAEAPVKQFNIVAFRITITYNAWGDTEHTGAMFAFVGEHHAIQEQVQAHWTKPVWRVQPLVIRVNVGDCIKLRFKNDLRADASLTISRAQYNVLRDEGLLVGRNATGGPIPKDGIHTYTFYIEDKAENQGAYPIHNMAADTIELSYNGLFAAVIAEPKGSEYISSYTGEPLNQEGDGGPAPYGGRWEAIILPCRGISPGESPSCDRLFNSAGAGPGTANRQHAFREHVLFYHDGIEVPGSTNRFTLGTGDSTIDPLIVQTTGITEDTKRFTLPSGAVLPVKGHGLIDGTAHSNTLAGLIGNGNILELPGGQHIVGAPGTPPNPDAPNNNNVSFNRPRIFGKAINYRTEPFDIRKAVEEDESLAYSAYNGGDASTPILRSYSGDPTVFRLIHGGGEEHHIPHIHGMHRWPRQPYAERDPDTGKFMTKMYLMGVDNAPDLTSSIARSVVILKNRWKNTVKSNEASLNHAKSTVTSIVDTTILTHQVVRDLEMECGAGSCQGASGDYIGHCHIADHYSIGMWHYWRVYNTRQSDLFPLPGRPTPPSAVDSIELIQRGKTLDGRRFCATGAPDCPDVENAMSINVDTWVTHLLPPAGVPEGCGLENPKACPHPDKIITCPSLEGKTGLDLLDALACQIKGYDPDHFDYAKRMVQGLPLYLNEPDGPTFENWPNSPNTQGPFGGIGDIQGRFAHWKDIPVDLPQSQDMEKIRNHKPGPSPGQRALLMFNPQDGRLAYPFFRPQRGKRPPLPGNSHTGAPFLGETDTPTRPGGLCPQDAPVRSYDILATPVLGEGAIYNRFGDRDPNAAVHLLVNDEGELHLGKRQPVSFIVRGNVGDCIDIQYRSHLTDANPLQEEFSKTNMHPHMMHFDVQATDGVIIGFNYEQSIRPSIDPFAGIKVSERCCTDRPTHRPKEFTRYRWYPDIELMAFWHPHLQGIYGFSTGLPSGTVIEPRGSTYRDRITGEDVYRTQEEFPEPKEYASVTASVNALAENPAVFGAVAKRGDTHHAGVGIMTRTISTPVNPATSAIANAGTEIVDIQTDGSEPSFREVAFHMVDDVNLLLARTKTFTGHMDGPSAVNLRAEPLANRLNTGMAPHDVFRSNSATGDPSTPLILAHPGDRVVFRLFSQGTQDVHSFRFAGPRFGWERFNAESRPIDAVQEGIGSFHHYELMGGAGGPSHVPGDYMWYMPIGALDFASGNWGILRVGQNPTLQSLGNKTNAGRTDVCAKATGIREYNVAAVPSPRRSLHAKKIFVLADAAGSPIRAELKKAQPLVMRANSGECMKVRLFNHLPDGKHIGMTPGLLTFDPKTSYGFNFGTNPGRQTAAPGESVEYTWFAEPQMRPIDQSLINPREGIGAIEWSRLGPIEQNRELGLSQVVSFANVPDDLNDGLFAAVVVEPAGSLWFDSKTGEELKPSERTSISAIIVPPPGDDGTETAFREHVIFMHENSVEFRSSVRPQLPIFDGSFNYRRAVASGMRDVSNIRKLRSVLTLESQAKDPTKVRIVYVNGSQDRTFKLDGHRAPIEAGTPQSNSLNAWNLNVGHKVDMELDHGASQFPGDYLFAATEHRSVMDGGQWGIFRVLNPEEASAMSKKNPKTNKRKFMPLDMAITQARTIRAERMSNLTSSSTRLHNEG